MNNPQPFPVPPPKINNRLAVTSLVLGIMSFVCLLMFLTGIPAIITGHIAHNRARKRPQEYGGAGLALAGLITGYVSLLFTLFMVIMSALLVPAFSKARGKATSLSCVNNMKQLSLAARMWAIEHNDTLPPDFRSMSNELAVPNILVCPDDKSKTKAPDFATLQPAQHISYEFLKPGAKEADVTAEVIFRCPIHGNVARGDGSVEKPGH